VGYLLASDKYTDDEAVAAVEAAGYALKTDIHAPYTNDEAVAAVEAAGYAKAASLLKSVALNQEGELTDQPFIPQSEITIVVDPGVSLGTVAIDFSAKGLVEYVPPSAGGDPGDPELTWATFWRCHIDVVPSEDSELEQIELYDDSQMESLFDVTPRTSTTKTRFHRIYFEASQAWRDEGFTLQLYCNAFCSPIGSPSSGCEFETAAKASVTTF
jgi:hypothetical protein